MKITLELLSTVSRDGALSLAQKEALGLPQTLQKGWQSTLLGRDITTRMAKDLLLLKGIGSSTLDPLIPDRPVSATKTRHA